MMRYLNSAACDARVQFWAHAVIDAGADVVVGHGPHVDRGIEIYAGKPIVYSLGNFIMQNDQVELMPHVALCQYGAAGLRAAQAETELNRVAQRALERFRDLSAPFGTEIAIEEGVGTVRFE
jgi:poly-gamma-glutamate capsule biosynthesis protein CapA/YwtB (metallophosphatase superfamily)